VNSFADPPLALLLGKSSKAVRQIAMSSEEAATKGADDSRKRRFKPASKGHHAQRELSAVASDLPIPRQGDKTCSTDESAVATRKRVTP